MRGIETGKQVIVPTKIEVCQQIDFSPCLPDDPQAPICNLGHGWSSGCLKGNSCPDYQPSEGLTLEEVKLKYSIE